MKKKSVDIGLAHIQKLSIRAARDSKQLINELKENFGKDRGEEIVKTLLSASENGITPEFYDVKNKDYDVSMVFSGCYDADIIRKVCNWISEHKEFFGDTILEVGCDCGFMTTFLGSFFPNKHILAIDRCQGGLEIARKNVEKFGLTNVEFLCTDVKELSGKTFDTVFSLRTMQENGDISEIDKSNMDLIPKSKAFSEKKQPYAMALAQLLKDHGTLVSIERAGRDALLFGWVQALDNTGLKVHSDQYDELPCNDMGDISYFKLLVYSKDMPEHTNSLKNFIDCCSQKMSLNLSEYNGWDAQIMKAYATGKMIEGYEINDTRFALKSIAIISSHKYDLNKIVYYRYISGQQLLDIVPASELKDVIEGLHESVYEAQSQSYMEVIKL